MSVILHVLGTYRICSREPPPSSLAIFASEQYSLAMEDFPLAGVGRRWGREAPTARTGTTLVRTLLWEGVTDGAKLGQPQNALPYSGKGWRKSAGNGAAEGRGRGVVVVGGHHSRSKGPE